MSLSVANLSRKWIYRHFLFFLLALVVLVFYGYYFGTADQSSHIPFLKKSIDPSLFPNDKFFNLRDTHYSYFWLLFRPLYQSNIFEISLFVIHVITTYLTFWGIWKLSQVLFKNNLTSVLAMISLLFQHYTFSGFTFFEFSLLNRTFTLPFELFAISWYLEKKFLRTFFILGILYNFHILSVNFILGMILFDQFMNIRRIKMRRFIAQVGLFVIGALPVLYWKAKGPAIGLGSNWDWFTTLDKGMFAYLFHFFSSSIPIINALTASGVATLVIFFLMKQKVKSESNSSITNFFYAGCILLCIQAIASHLYPSVLIIESQVFRVGVFLMMFAYLYAAEFVAVQLHREKLHWSNGLLVISLLFSFTPVIFLLTILAIKSLSSRITNIVACVIVIILEVVFLKTIWNNEVWRPGIHIYPEKTPLYEAQIWAKSYTPKSAVFIVPPGLHWQFTPEWRVFSERSTVSTLSELLEAAFSPDYIGYWKERFVDVAPGALAEFKGDYVRNRIIAQNAYSKLSDDKIQTIALKYNATYIMVEKKYSHDFLKVYENSQYAIYKIF